jgi:cysteine desulfurase
MKQKYIYLDYAASTPIDPIVLETLTESYHSIYGNTSGIHHFAQAMEYQLEENRSSIAKTLNSKNSEIIFTSSATESNNSVLFGVAEAYKNKGSHMIISDVEHASIDKTCLALEKKGISITRIKVDKNGLIDLNALRSSITNQTILVSIIYVNNETGSIQPMHEISQICKENHVLLHTDAVQALGKINVDMQKIPIDFLTASSHKIYGPIGCGLLLIRSGVKIEPLLHGGGQEFGMRASTVNVHLINAFSKAVHLMVNYRKKEQLRMQLLAEMFREGIAKNISDYRINSSQKQSIPNIMNVSFSGCDSEMLIMMLNKAGVAVSSGAACSSGNIYASRILKACGLPPKWLSGAIRFSFGRFSSEASVSAAIEVLIKTVEKVRKIS